jgi:CubicO group peptidase (beta-lactamase class C family)
LFAGGQATKGRMLKSSTLDQMWTPQFAPAGKKTGYGIGFGIGEINGHRTIGHGGAIYGFATSLKALPDEKLGVVVVTTKDSCERSNESYRRPRAKGDACGACGRADA